MRRSSSMTALTSGSGTCWRTEKAKTEIEGRSIGREAPQAFNRTEIDGRLQRLRDAQQCCLAFESDDSLDELGQDGRQAPEPAADIARRREGERRSYTRTQQLSNVTLLEIRAQDCPGTVDVYHFARSPDYTLHILSPH
jgi:hypothetical protein